MASQLWGQDLAASTVGPFTTVTAASITPIVPDITIPANYFTVGSKLRATMYGKVTTAASSPGTFTLTVNWGGTGGTNLATSGALSYVAAATNIPWRIDYTIVCTALANGVGTLFVQGMFETLTSVLATPSKGFIPASAPAAVGSLTFTAATALDFAITMSAATNSWTTDMYILESIGY